MQIGKKLVALILLCICGIAYPQDKEIDTSKKSIMPMKIKKAGGIFISPVIGAELPIKNLNENSKYTFSFGGKLEYSSLNIYPIVIGASFQFQNHSGSDDYKTKYILNSLNTKITSFGLCIDVLLNKYLKSSFTIPFVFIELRSLSIKREISPESNLLDIKTDDNLIGFGGGFGFTLYIFDIYTNYLSAKDYSTISIKTRIRFPLIKF